MNKLALYFGEPYQRRKAAKDFIRKWYNSLEEPEFYRLEGSRVTASELEQYLGGASLFSKSKIIRITGIEELAEKPSIASILVNHEYQNEAVLLECESIDKRTKLYKTLSKKATTKKFSYPDKRKFPRFVTQILREYEVELTTEAQRWFVQIMELDLLRVEREVQKMKLFQTGTEGPLNAEDLQEVVWAQGKDKLFDFFGALLARDVSGAMSLLNEMLSKGVEPSEIFYMLAGEVRKLIEVQDLLAKNKSIPEISQETGIYKWLVSKKEKQLDNFTGDELLKLIFQLQDEDVAIKFGQTDVLDALLRMVFALSPRITV